MVADANAPRPITAGGTGASNVTTARSNLQVARSAATTADFTAGRGLIVGSGGLLGNALTTGATNFNDIVTGERWSISSPGDLANPPPTTVSGTLIVVNRADNRLTQLFVTAGPTQGGDIYARALTGTGWTAWGTFYNSRNLVGTVSQASGVVTGAAFEVVENSEGYCSQKFADGSMVKWATVTVEYESAAELSTVFSFPGDSFVNASWVGHGNLRAVVSMAPSISQIAQIRVFGVGASAANVAMVRAAGATDFVPGNTATIDVTIRGRWTGQLS